ncbi:MAG TPA: ABC transporter ATP-binding protein [Dermatophilaceae bacterium]|nr:ABC transporter ATP-binding protein [Dermatophilaceae bacterium]
MRVLPFDDPGTPPVTTARAFLWWVARGQWTTLAAGMVFGVVWMVSQALVPATISRAIDEGIVGGDRGALWRWSGAVALLGLTIAGSGIMRHRMAVSNWLTAAFRAIQLVGWKAADTGAALPRTIPTGDVVAAVANDAMRLGSVYDVTARFSGAVVSFGVVAGILLSASTELGLVVLIGVPLLVAALTFVVRPLQQRQASQREESGRLIGLGADTVAGLRVLRGIGGEQTFLSRYAAQSTAVRDSGFRVAGMQATLDAAQILLPGVFVVLVTWLGGRFAIDGRITPGQLVAFYGYSAFLVLPLRTATEFVDRATKSYIAAGKIIAVLRVPGDHEAVPASASAESPLAPSVPGSPDVPTAADSDEMADVLVDGLSGLTVRRGEFLGVVSAVPAESAALADRLGRFGADQATFERVLLHGIPLAQWPVAEVRARVLVSETDPRLFAGSLRSALDPWGRLDDDQLLAVLDIASGADILEALPEGLDSVIDERGRSLSGGQRQRLALARAVLAEPEVLVLVEPTSAVDAHTEARIAARLADHRRGRTTVVVSASPLVLSVADEVVLLDGGSVVARGRHHDLVRGDAAYRAVVVRGEDAKVTA